MSVDRGKVARLLVAFLNETFIRPVLFMGRGHSPFSFYAKTLD